MTISEMLARNASLFPDDVALIELTPSEGKRKQISWQEFDNRANKIANAVRAKGIRKGEHTRPYHHGNEHWGHYWGDVFHSSQRPGSGRESA